MSENIPTYKLDMLTEKPPEYSGFFFSGQKSERPKIRIDVPYRSGYYKIAVCLRGCADVKVNLETYKVEPDCLIIMSPHIIKQWTYISGDYESADIFFTERFMTTNSSLNLNKFPFFDKNARHVCHLSPDEVMNLSGSLKVIHQKGDTSRSHRDDVVKSLVTSLLYETAAIYDGQTEIGSSLTKKEILAAEFKNLVSIYCSAERNLKFYAAKLFITPKHLTETVKDVTGKTAGDWIAESVVLEAKVLLQNPLLNIGQISDALNFPDQSTFGKFFKKQTGISPAAYKQRI